MNFKTAFIMVAAVVTTFSANASDSTERYCGEQANRVEFQMIRAEQIAYNNFNLRSARGQRIMLAANIEGRKVFEQCMAATE